MRHKIETKALLEDLKRVAALLGRCPARREYDWWGAYCSWTCVERAGSWRAWCAQCGLTPPGAGAARTRGAAPRAGQRLCLRCDRPFVSQGSHNRICEDCKATDAWREPDVTCVMMR